MEKQNDKGLLVSIHLNWDAIGSIQHRFSSNLEFNDYQKSDALSFSSMVSTTNQLGVMSVSRSLVLCCRLLDFIEKGDFVNEPINSALTSVQVDLLQGNNLIHQFKPVMEMNSTNDSIEDGVRQFLNNYFIYVSSIISENFCKKMKNVMLISMDYYLSEALPKALLSENFDISKNDTIAQSYMIGFAINLYPYWSSPGILQISDERIHELSTKVRQAHKQISEKLGLIKSYNPPAKRKETLNDIEEMRQVLGALDRMEKATKDEFEKRRHIAKMVGEYYEQSQILKEQARRKKNQNLKTILWIVFSVIAIFFLWALSNH